MQLWTFSFKLTTWKSCGFTAHRLPNVCTRWCLGGTEKGRLAKAYITQLYQQFLLWGRGHCPTLLIVCSAGLCCGWKWTVNLCPSPLDPSLKGYTVAKICRPCSLELHSRQKKKSKTKKKTKNAAGSFHKGELWGGHVGDCREQNKGAQMRGSLPRRWWHHSLAPSAKPGYKRCRDLRCRPEPLFL